MVFVSIMFLKAGRNRANGKGITALSEMGELRRSSLAEE